MRPLIVLSGPDAAGKTTLAYNLACVFKKEFNHVKVVRIRGTHTLAFILSQILKNVLHSEGSDLHYFKIRIPKKLVKLWIWIELISIVPLLFYYYYILRLKYLVISERGIPDFIIWVLTGFSEVRPSEIITFFPLKIALIWAIKVQAIFVTASKNVLIDRKKDEKQLIERMYKYFGILAKAIRLPVIDTSYMTLKDSLNIILEIINKEKNGEEACEKI